MTRIGKLLEYTPKIGDRENNYPITLFLRGQEHKLGEREFLEIYQEYMHQKYQTGYEYVDQLHTRNGHKDHRSIALACIQKLAHDLWRSWNEAASFDEVLLDELLLWIKMLDELRPTFGCLRFFPNEWVNKRIVRIRSQYPKWVQEEFDFWKNADDQDREEHKQKLEEKIHKGANLDGKH